MSLRFRRSVKIAPGVRINFNKNSMGLTLGPRGAHYTINSSGRRTVSAGLPGTGLWWQESSNPNSKRARAQAQAQAQIPLYEKDVEDKPKPAFFAKHYENDIYQALLNMSQKQFEDIVTKYPNDNLFAKFMLITIMCSKPETGRAGLAIAEEVWSKRSELVKDALYIKYAPGIKSQMQIVPGVYYKGPYTAHLLGYLLFELYVVDESYDKAEKVLSEISPDFYTPIAKMELEYLQKKFEKVISDTAMPHPDTNESAAQEMYRAMALRETGDSSAAILLFTEVIKSKGLDPALILRSRYERGLAYIKAKDHKNALADMEYVISKDGDYLDVRKILSELRKEK
jgi:tetratricopeptide (TPR) repeat protein